MSKIRHLYIAVLSAFTFCGCSIIAPVTTRNTFGNTLNEVATDLKKEGFLFLGSSSNLSYERNAPRSTRTYWAPGAPIDPVTEQPNLYPQSGFGLENKVIYDKVYNQTLCFANNEGDTLLFTVSYKHGDYYVDEVEVSGCRVSNPTLHDRLCGDYSPIRKLEDMPKDTTAVFK